MRSSTKIEPAKDSRGRGRPPKYDRVEALGCAMQTFHRKGYAATSLDDLAQAMNMNRPSVYNAFGDKQTLYQLTLDFFVEDLRQTVGQILFAPTTLQIALKNFYKAALDVYCAEKPQRGCFVFCTAPAEAINSPEIATHMQQILSELDGVLTQRFQQAIDEGEIASDRSDSAEMRAKTAQAILHSVALRARAGESRRSLNRFVNGALALLIAAN